jgi:hypothetical protein
VLLQEITNGEGTIFTFRDLFPGWPGLSDTSSLQYMTIHIPYDLGKNREIDLSKEHDVLTVLTEGAPSFRNFCFGYASKGKLSIKVLNGYDDATMNKMSQHIFHSIGDDAVLMDIDITVNTKNTNIAWPDQCGTCTLQGSFVFMKSSVNQINKD